MTDSAWTVRTLKTALDRSDAAAAGEFSARIVKGPDTVLLVTMHSQGDLAIFLNVSEAQNDASVLLRPCAEQTTRAALIELLHNTQKKMTSTKTVRTTVRQRMVQN